jgi:carboxylesterase
VVTLGVYSSHHTPLAKLRMTPISAIGLIAVLLTAAGVASYRAMCRRRAELDCAGRLPLDSEGIVVGAAPITLDAGDGAPAVLMVHGGGDTPQTLRYLAEDLHTRGFTVRVPLLPGHGRMLRAFADVSDDAWLRSVHEEMDALSRRHAWTALVGLSMGGALAVRVAATRSALPALCLIAPYLEMPVLVRRAAETSRVWGPMVPYVRAGGARPSIDDPDERTRSLAYGYFTPAALRALARTVTSAVDALPAVRVPTLMLQSRKDNRITPDAASTAFARLGAADKELVWVDGAHVLTVDRDRRRVFEAVAGWMIKHGAPLKHRQVG